MNDHNAKSDVPPFIYGTAWKEEQTQALTKLALETGFRAIDTANQLKHYYEEGVGHALSEAFEDGLVDREELFVQTKFTYEQAQDDRMPYDANASYEDQVHQSLESSLDHLQLDYVDSLLLHGPRTRSGLTEADREVWKTFEELLETGRVQYIGISNVLPDQLQDLISLANHVPDFVQNRCYARTGWGQTTRELCEEHGIGYQGFSLLTANRQELQSEEVVEIARRRERTIPQITFRFALAAGIIPLTGTTSEEHMQQDLACVDFELTDEEIRTIGEIALDR